MHACKPGEALEGHVLGGDAQLVQQLAARGVLWQEKRVRDIERQKAWGISLGRAAF